MWLACQDGNTLCGDGRAPTDALGEQRGRDAILAAIHRFGRKCGDLVLEDVKRSAGTHRRELLQRHGPSQRGMRAHTETVPDGTPIMAIDFALTPRRSGARRGTPGRLYCEVDPAILGA